MPSTNRIFTAKTIRFWSPAEIIARKMIRTRSSKTISQMMVSASLSISFRLSMRDVSAIAVLEI